MYGLRVIGSARSKSIDCGVDVVICRSLSSRKLNTTNIIQPYAEENTYSDSFHYVYVCMAGPIC